MTGTMARLIRRRPGTFRRHASQRRGGEAGAMARNSREGDKGTRNRVDTKDWGLSGS